MRIPIREQLGLLVLLCSLLALMVLSVATWTQNHGFIINIRLSALTLVASLKAAQVSASLLLYQTTVHSISTRLIIQSTLRDYNAGNSTDGDWNQTRADLQSAMLGGARSVALQAIIFPKNDSGTGNVHGLTNVTSRDKSGKIRLPALHPSGDPVYLGDPGLGYPPSLYPNLTYTSDPLSPTGEAPQARFDGHDVRPDGTLILGPMAINESFYLLSMTVAIRNNTANSDVLGWLTVVLDASLTHDAIASPEGLQDTGQVLVVTPTSPTNQFNTDLRFASAELASKQQVQYAFAPQSNSSLGDRHRRRAMDGGNPGLPFAMDAYPAVVEAWTRNNSAINNAGALILSHSEEDEQISVGYATLSVLAVDWVLLFEQSYGEVIAPVNHLRDVVLACVFATTGLIMLLLFPAAHFAVRPIRQLRAATTKTVKPIPLDNGATDRSVKSRDDDDDAHGSGDEEALATSPGARKEGFLTTISRWRRPTRSPVRAGLHTDGPQASFKIPGKVPERHPWIKDELSDLTSTFNEMSDELVLQYARLEERVKERTTELEASKKAAESANASKTLFIANISHELKTPLNGIMGMCAVCMQEEDMRKIRQSLGIIYKSGDLLLHLLNDLLTFSKNSIGQQLTIDEDEFTLLDVSTQVTAIFQRQAKDGEIDLQVEFLGPCDALGDSSQDSGPRMYGPAGTGRVRDMCLWGDKDRILQVLINLVSNSLKFTPPHGSVHVRIKCTGIADEETLAKLDCNRKPSVQSKQSRKSRGSWRKRPRDSDQSLHTSAAGSETHIEKAESRHSKEINVVVAGAAKHLPQVAVRTRSVSPPPLNTKTLLFEFAVTDTGPGIPQDQMTQIFEPFVQGDLGLSKKFAGTGLGLSICAQLANLMGGGITLQSTEGVGSTFSVNLPLRYVSERPPSTSSSPVRPASSRSTSVVGKSFADERSSRNASRADIHADSHGTGHTNMSESEKLPRQDVPRIVGFSQPYFPQEVVRTDGPSPKLSEMKQAENEAAKKGEKVRVLVAEDNKVNQEVVTRMLKLESVYDVTIAKDGQVALDLVRDSMEPGKQRFNLIFMDVQMPNLDGIQSTRLIREIGFSAPIVALTAFAEESNIQDCYNSGMDFFLPKPIRRRELKNVLTKYCPPTIHEDEPAPETEGRLSPRRPKTRKRAVGNGSMSKAAATAISESSDQPAVKTSSAPAPAPALAPAPSPDQPPSPSSSSRTITQKAQLDPLSVPDSRISSSTPTAAVEQDPDSKSDAAKEPSSTKDTAPAPEPGPAEKTNGMGA